MEHEISLDDEIIINSNATNKYEKNDKKNIE